MKQAREFLFYPMKVIKDITEKNPSKYLWIFSSILGVIFLIELFETISLGRSFTLGLILAIAILLSPIVGYFLVNIGSWIISGSGMWLGHRAKFKNIRACLSYSLLPLIGYILCQVVLILVFGGRLFVSFPEGQHLSLSEAFILYTVIVVQIVFFIWTLLLLIQSLSVVKRMSIGKAIINLIVAFIILGLIVFLVSLPFIDRCSSFFDFPELTNNELYESWEETLF